MNKKLYRDARQGGKVPGDLSVSCRIHDELPCLFGTVGDRALERFGVSKGRKDCKLGRPVINFLPPPLRYLIVPESNSAVGVIGFPLASRTFRTSITAIVLAITNHKFDSANAFPGHTLRPNPHIDSTFLRTSGLDGFMKRSGLKTSGLGYTSSSRDKLLVGRSAGVESGG
jgi:hypothetical protein